jgi:Cellulose binding domain
MSRPPIGRVFVALVYAGGVLAACAADGGDPGKKDAGGPVATVDSGVVDTGGGGGFDSASGSDSPFEQVDSTSPAVDTGSPEEAGSDDVVVDSPTVCTSCKLTAQYMNGATGDPTSDITPHFQIVNDGVTPQDLTTVTLRYWYTEDSSTSQAFACDYALIGCGVISAKFVAMTTTTTTADHYMELSFSSGSVAGEGGMSGTINTRFHDSTYAMMMTQSNDYSYVATDSTFTSSMQVTLYVSGALVWGTEP